MSLRTIVMSGALRSAPTPAPPPQPSWTPPASRGLFAPGSWSETPLPPNTAIDPLAADSAAAWRAQADKAANINIGTFSLISATIPLAERAQHLVPAQLRKTDGTIPTGASSLYRFLATQGFPVPDGVTFQNDSDSAFQVLQTDANGKVVRIDEAWKSRMSADGTTFLCQSYGRVLNVGNHPGYYRNYGYENPTGTFPSTYESIGMGVHAIHVPQACCSIVTRQDLERGYVDHPIGISGVSPAGGSGSGYKRWPAQLYDTANSRLLPQGGRWRLPADWVITSTNRYQRVLQQAARDWGLVHVDSAYAVGFRGQPGTGEFLDGQPGYAVAQAFPWQNLQLLVAGSPAQPVVTT